MWGQCLHLSKQPGERTRLCDALSRQSIGTCAGAFSPGLTPFPQVPGSPGLCVLQSWLPCGISPVGRAALEEGEQAAWAPGSALPPRAQHLPADLGQVAEPL